MYKKVLLIILAILTAYCLILNTANAQGLSLGIDPPIFQITAKPPANVSAPLTIHNLSNQALDLSIIFKPFIPSDQETGQVSYQNDNKQLPPVQVTLNNEPITEVSLAPKQKRELTLKINIPKDSILSDYYFSIVFLSKNKSAENLNSSQNIAGIASNVLLSIGPKGPVKGTIQEFSAPLFLEKGPVLFTVRVKNTGDRFITPRGQILIKNVFGQTVGKVDLDETNVLSESVRLIPDSQWLEKFILGPYSASLTIALSDEGPIFRRSILFLAFPFKYSVGLILALLIVIYIVRGVRKKV